jgi:outer membrane biosynthesis protein TonB
VKEYRYEDGIPDFLLRKNQVAEGAVMSEQIASEEEVKPKAKPAKKAAAKPEKQAKPKAKAEKPAKKAAAAKAPDKAKAAKPKAEKKAKAEKDQWGLRKGSSKSEAAAMYARKNGATLEEVKEQVGSIQLNVLKELEAEGHFVQREKVERKGQRPLTRYKLIAK